MPAPSPAERWDVVEERREERFDLWHEVPLVPQLTGMSCWAAAAAMILGWRDSVPVQPEEVARGAGRWRAYRDGLEPSDVPALARSWGLRIDPLHPRSVEDFRQLLQAHGPLWVGEASPGLHSVVIAGMHGDGTPDRTWIRVADPWPQGRGERYSVTFRDFMRSFQAAAEIGGQHSQVLHAGGRRAGASSSQHHFSHSVERRSQMSMPYAAARSSNRYRPARSMDAPPAAAAWDERLSRAEADVSAGFFRHLTGKDLADLQAARPEYEAAGAADLHDRQVGRLQSVLDAVRAWILDTSASAISQLRDPARRRHFLEEVSWDAEHFPTRGESGTEPIALFAALAGVCRERRVNIGADRIRYHDVTSEVVSVPGEGGRKLYPDARDAYVRAKGAAAADGVSLAILSGWRSREQQQRLQQGNSNPNAVAQGISTHNYGLAVDLGLSASGLQVREGAATSATFSNLIRMYRSPIYKWMFVNGERFGFYPYRQEPWHWEYNPPGFKGRFEAATGTSLRALAHEGVSYGFRPARRYGFRSALAASLVRVGGSGSATDATLISTELDTFPEDTLQAMNVMGVSVVVCRGSVTDYLTSLRGVHPRGWPAGATWDSVPGLNNPSASEVVIAVVGHGTPAGAHVPLAGEGHGSFNLVLHECLHAVDTNGQPVSRSSMPQFTAARTADLSTLSAYESQPPPAGPEETYAESGARYFGADSTDSASHPNLHTYWDSHVPGPSTPANG